MKHWLDMVVALLQASTSDLRELAQIAGANPRTFYRGVNFDDLEVEGQDLEGMEFSSVSLDENNANDQSEIEAAVQPGLKPIDVVRKIRAAPRQEERIAMLLDTLLKEANHGAAILENYTEDRAKFATYALMHIRELVPAHSNNHAFDERIVAALVQKFFSYTYPMNRGRLLYFFAKYLGTYPIVNAAIKQILSRTASMFVNEYRQAIETQLKV